jgi:hypothetical protein
LTAVFISATVSASSGFQPGVSGSSESKIASRSAGEATHAPAAPSTSM